MKTLDPRAAAAMYLDMGLYPIPLPPNSKIPAPGFRWRICEVTRSNIEELFAPNSNTALCCKRSGIGIVDCDTQEALDYALEHFDPTGTIAETPRGGRHLFYVGKEIMGNRQNMCGVMGLDFRGPGGYALVQPSKIDGRPYRFLTMNGMAEWKNEWVPKTETKPLEIATKLGDEDAAERYISKITAVEGMRDTTAFRVACILTQKFGLPAEVAAPMLKTWNRYACRPPLHEKRLEYKIAESIRLKH